MSDRTKPEDYNSTLCYSGWPMWSEGCKFFPTTRSEAGVSVFNAKLTECFSEMKRPCVAWVVEEKKKEISLN